MKIALALAAAGLALATPLAAQDVSPEALSQVQPADPASVSDEEIATFVTVVMQAQALEEDESLSDEQRIEGLFNAAIAQGMSADRFVALSMAIGQDEALQQRVQAAVIGMVPGDAEG
ncbi:hypothetical protein [Aurantiacibacter luteus]|uniref:DUF4168 domain-containing protein n=1 Tax=Aurantiacibacter luteus TaxID=1581420 RepID=A0A0G9MWH1_9SPHN|nr:hypothetical protein [Aurantiacibacter luteus]KLE35065.1 hypothetical protein AAW00_00770 [Aurantiacibacter luteus]